MLSRLAVPVYSRRQSADAATTAACHRLRNPVHPCPPAARTARAASASDAPVVIRSSTSTTRRPPAAARRRRTTSSAPARFASRCRAPSPDWSATGRRCRSTASHPRRHPRPPQLPRGRQRDPPRRIVPARPHRPPRRRHGNEQQRPPARRTGAPSAPPARPPPAPPPSAPRPAAAPPLLVGQQHRPYRVRVRGGRVHHRQPRRAPAHGRTRLRPGPAQRRPALRRTARTRPASSLRSRPAAPARRAPATTPACAPLCHAGRPTTPCHPCGKRRPASAPKARERPHRPCTGPSARSRPAPSRPRPPSATAPRRAATRSRPPSTRHSGSSLVLRAATASDSPVGPGQARREAIAESRRPACTAPAARRRSPGRPPRAGCRRAQDMAVTSSICGAAGPQLRAPRPPRRRSCPRAARSARCTETACRPCSTSSAIRTPSATPSAPDPPVQPGSRPSAACPAPPGTAAAPDLRVPVRHPQIARRPSSARSAGRRLVLPLADQHRLAA